MRVILDITGAPGPLFGRREGGAEVVGGGERDRRHGRPQASTGIEDAQQVLSAEGNADTIDIGARIWDSGRALAKWMSVHLQDQPRRILELL